jgi:alpha-2-macroglobulin
MNDAITHVLTHQNEDGGFGLWPSTESEGFLTAYGLWGLLTAREHGYEVPEARMVRAIAYLRTHTAHGGDMHGQFNDAETQPFAAYVLARAERGDDTLSTSLAGREATLSRFSVGLLANALSRSSASAPLFAALERAEVDGRSGKMIDEGAPAGFMEYGSDLRATSSAVQALVAEGRVAEAEDLVAGILASRDPSGGWGSTYNNLWAIYALSAFSSAVERTQGPATVTVVLGTETIATVRVGAGQSIERVVIPADRLPAPGNRTELTIRTAGGSSARYSARLRYVAEVSAQRAEEHGLRVTRALLDADTGRPVTSPRVGQLLRVRLTLRSEGDLQQVALTDRLPAGFEPVDTSLATSERRARDQGDPWTWTFREIHDERVAFFANHLHGGEHTAEYLVRASRSGEFVRPAPTSEAMYDPRVWGRGEVERVRITR